MKNGAQTRNGSIATARRGVKMMAVMWGGGRYL
jgi:hypothetical protein